MNNKLMEFNKSQKTAELPKLRAGDVVKIFRKIIEGGKERTQVFEGMIIAIKGAQSSSAMITVRKVSNGFGVEIVVPVQSPNIEKIELLKRAKVRSSKLYYVRDRSAKSLKMKFTDAAKIGKEEKEVPVVKAKKVKEEVIAEETKATEVVVA